MVEWLVENATVVANLASLFMLAVWAFYALLFYREFKRQRTPFFVIHQAKGHGIDSTCLIVNLSREPVHILCVMLRLHTARGTYEQRLRNFRRRSDSADLGSDVQTTLKQGPLTSGGFFGLGSFEAMLEAAMDDVLRRSGAWADPDGEIELQQLIQELRELEIRLIALHGAHDQPVGAVRSFQINLPDEDGDEATIEPAMLLTRQVNSRRESRLVRQWLQECLPRPVPDEH